MRWAVVSGVAGAIVGFAAGALFASLRVLWLMCGRRL